LLPLFLIVITNPYKDLDYERANVYIITRTYVPLDISTTESEYSEEGEDSYFEEETFGEEYYVEEEVEYNYVPYSHFYNTSQEREYNYFRAMFDNQ